MEAQDTIKLARCVKGITITLGDENGYCVFNFKKGKIYEYEDIGAYVSVKQEKAIFMTKNNFNILFDIVKEINE